MRHVMDYPVGERYKLYLQQLYTKYTRSNSDFWDLSLVDPKHRISVINDGHNWNHFTNQKDLKIFNENGRHFIDIDEVIQHQLLFLYLCIYTLLVFILLPTLS